MDPWLRNIGGTIIVGLTVLIPRAAEAQLVSLRTVPLPAGEQFLFTPTQTLGMGGPSFALQDAWGDGFVNPARGSRSEKLRLFTLPTFYSADGPTGGGATLPFAFVGRGARVFGGAAFAVQAADDPNAVSGWNGGYYPMGTTVLTTGNPAKPAGLGAPVNRYGAAYGGWTLGDGRTSVGFGFSAAHLENLSPVERLFWNSRTWIAEAGNSWDARVGVLRDLGAGRSIEALLLNTRSDFSYDVGRAAWGFMAPSTYTTRYWTDHNRDRDNIWGAHVRYVGGVARDGWRTSFIGTVNRKTYPSLPNYDVASVPRDPGESWAFQAGVGANRTTARRTVVYELVVEPAWSHTWANSADSAGAPVVRTSENWLHFVNGHVLAGAEHRTSWGALQYGLRLDEVHYSISRQVFSAGSSVESGSTWLEWTPTWGIALHAGMAELRYTGHITMKGAPDLGWGESKTTVQPPTMDTGDYLPPVIGGWTRDFWSAAHQITFSVPLGRKVTADKR
jgi:hypothetical protein